MLRYSQKTTFVSSLALALPPSLHEGDHLDTTEFLRRWEAMPDLQFAELIDGVVFMASLVALDHASMVARIVGWLFVYQSHTPGCAAGSDGTWIMGPNDSPQPDAFLRILPEHGGQSTTSGKYPAGSPELIVEISDSTLSRDHGIKLELYRRSGVREYITVQLAPRAFTWRTLSRGRYRELAPAPDGSYRSRAFPGLWLHPETLWSGNVLDTLQLGLASPEHSTFCARLAAKARKRR
jgi:hypothetical protein